MARQTRVHYKCKEVAAHTFFVNVEFQGFAACPRTRSVSGAAIASRQSRVRGVKLVEYGVQAQGIGVAIPSLCLVSIVKQLIGKSDYYFESLRIQKFLYIRSFQRARQILHRLTGGLNSGLTR